MSDAMSLGVVSGTLPWSRSCFVCGQDNPHGLHLRSRVDGDRVVIDYTTREADLGWRHIVHGGLIMTLLDEVMTWGAILASRQACVCADMSTRLKRPVEVGQPLRVEGWVTLTKARIVTTEGRILNQVGQTMASATGKYMPMPAEQVPLCAGDFVLSPGTIDPGWTQPS